MAGAKDELIEYALNTVCQKQPECCQPRDIKMVMFDADDTMWRIEPYGIASNISGKMTLIDENTLEVESTYTPSKHPYDTVNTPRKPPHGRKKKRWWKESIIPESEFPDWVNIAMGGEADEELKQIGQELIESVNEPEEAPAAAKEEVILDKVTGWEITRQNQIDNLIDRYGKGVCKIFDVRDNGTIDINCRGDIWMLTKDGHLIGKQSQPPPLPAPTVSTIPTYWYMPKKVTITLLPTFRETIKALKDRNIPATIISLNTPGSVKRIVEAFGMKDDFVEVADTWENKGKVFEDISRRFKVCPCDAMFVDNTLSHVQEVGKKCGLALQIGKNADIEKPIEIMRYIK